MLTSLDINGDVPDATVLVAAFELDEAHKAAIRLGAGRLSRRLRFIDITTAMLQGVNAATLERYPPAALGRLMLAEQITRRDARLLTLDSDMIVNASLRPLFEVDLQNNLLAAVHDPPRTDDPHYFNSGMILTSVTEYIRQNIGQRSVAYVAQHRPYFADQDALNFVVGDNWLRLNHEWNFFTVPGRVTNADDYDHCKIGHFPASKPWENPDHPGARLYSRYHSLYRLRLLNASL